ncbi:unnamed protein product [Heligmosomoides polygyrus]|uniref:Phage major capsid protein n=1 Tax=Heligmosomoides polygyrus TaxID=6339 RepID=A0A183G9G0_HELPZ|nr:unnamed protein product [Heligmosomoides polygyrus]
MTTIGSVKAQVTKAVKALRASMEEAEKLRTGQVPSNAPAAKSASVSATGRPRIGIATLQLTDEQLALHRDNSQAPSAPMASLNMLPVGQKAFV